MHGIARYTASSLCGLVLLLVGFGVALALGLGLGLGLAHGLELGLALGLESLGGGWVGRQAQREGCANGSKDTACPGIDDDTLITMLWWAALYHETI